MKIFLSIIILLFLFLSVNSFAQDRHEHHHREDTTDQEMQDHSDHMSHGFSRNLSMSRNGSGTAWLPDSSPMFGYMKHSDEWMYMIHGNIFFRYNNQDAGDTGSRGGDKFDMPNWFMGMGQTNVGSRGLFRFSTMLTLEPLTIGGAGYPLLFQSGETWENIPLVDRQHPHDLFSELSIAYTHMLSTDADVFIYAGYPGEPAYGPVAFMHRISGLYNPDASLGHHWQDATHITFGVGTIGFRYKNIKLDGSVFTGREPDEERYGFDRPRFDSYSVRVSYNPTAELALQVSKAWVNDVHEFGPREDVNKTTASAVHSLRLSSNTSLSSALIWGYNNPREHHSASHSILLESAFSQNASAIYGRYEWVEKSTEDLLLGEQQYGHDNLFNINAATLGFQQKIIEGRNTSASIGVQGTLYVVPADLKDLYGENPYALQAYLRVFPGLLN